MVQQLSGQQWSAIGFLKKARVIGFPWESDNHEPAYQTGDRKRRMFSQTTRNSTLRGHL